MRYLVALLVTILGVPCFTKNVAKGTAPVETNLQILERQVEDNPDNSLVTKQTLQKEKGNEDLHKHRTLPRKDTYVLKNLYCFWLVTCSNARYYKSCCKVLRPFCKGTGLKCRKKRNSCQKGWASVGAGCYRVVNAETYEIGEKSCSYSKGSMVEITSQAEQEVLTTFFEDSHLNGWVWLGAEKTKENEWLWIKSGKKIIFNLWDSGEPNIDEGSGDCLVWDGNKSWKDIGCDYRNESLITICERQKKSRPIPPDTANPSKPCTCGEPYQDLRIVGGETAEKNEYPWQVALMYGMEERPFCSGSLISRETVLTAAHCTEGLEPNEIWVSTGEHNVIDENDGQTKKRVKKIIQNDMYNFTTIDYDFSLLILKSPVRCDQKARPIRLPTQFTKYENVNATVSGWGAQNDTEPSDTLQKVDVTTMSNTECTTGTLYDTFDITPRMICASGSGKDACFGDSGGPLVTLEDDDYFSIIGIVSWGGKDCAEEDYPGVYSRVANETLWIQENMIGQTCLTPEANLKPRITKLEESVRSMEANIQNIQEMMRSFTTKFESCLADISSSECPQPASGKTSVAEGISDNTEAISGISSSNAALAAKDTQIESCLADISSSDCPQPASGKTSVAGGISDNTAALDDKCDASICSEIQEAISEIQPKTNLVVTGGNNAAALATSEIISPGGVCNEVIPPLPVALRTPKSTYFNNTLYVCGGYTNIVQNKCYQLRDSNSEWTEGPAMKIPRYDNSLTTVGQDLYALGGQDGWKEYDSMEKLSVSSGKWTLMDQKLTTLRRMHCTVFMERTKSLVTIGGSIGGYTSSAILNLVEEFSLATGTWTQLAPLPVERGLYSHRCAVLDQTIVVAGGVIPGVGNQKNVYAFAGGLWKTTGELKVARYYHGIGILDNKIFAFAGTNQYLDTIEEMQEDGSFRIMPWKLKEGRRLFGVAQVPREKFPCL